MKINNLSFLSKEVVEAARENLIIGTVQKKKYHSFATLSLGLKVLHNKLLAPIFTFVGNMDLSQVAFLIEYIVYFQKSTKYFSYF